MSTSTRYGQYIYHNHILPILKTFNSVADEKKFRTISENLAKLLTVAYKELDKIELNGTMFEQFIDQNIALFIMMLDLRNQFSIESYQNKLAEFISGELNLVIKNLVPDSDFTGIVQELSEFLRMKATTILLMVIKKGVENRIINATSAQPEMLYWFGYLVQFIVINFEKLLLKFKVQGVMDGDVEPYAVVPVYDTPIDSQPQLPSDEPPPGSVPPAYSVPSSDISASAASAAAKSIAKSTLEEPIYDEPGELGELTPEQQAAKDAAIAARTKIEEFPFSFTNI